MNNTATLFGAIMLVGVLTCSGYSQISVVNSGEWPDSWPTKLEFLRKDATTHIGPDPIYQRYQIPFSCREDFETAWPHILKLKGKDSVLVLRSSPFPWLHEIKAGVNIHPIVVRSNSDQADQNITVNSMNKEIRGYSIELIVEGNIVDLNRIELPADFKILDKRFEGKGRFGPWGASGGGIWISSGSGDGGYEFWDPSTIE